MTNFEIYTYLKSKNGGGGEPVPSPVTNPALRLMDWEGTVLKEYTAEQVANLTALPTPPSLRTDVDRDLLSFQGYNWALSDIKSWVDTHEGKCLTVGAIYTTTDGQDHNYWNNPRLTTATTISRHKRGTTTIGISAFGNCYSLTSINLPEGVTTIGNDAFGNCCTLKNINLPDSVTSIGNGAFSTCYSLTSINIPEGVTSIGIYTFYNCYSLTNINIPEGVTNIGNSAFNGCRSLTSINLPEGVTNIGSSAFNSCFSLTSIAIPEGVTTIGESAFYNCRSLTDIVVKGNPNLANVNAFDNIYSGYLIYVPRAKLSWYSTATNWITLYNDNKIVAIEDNVEYLESIGIDV